MEKEIDSASAFEKVEAQLKDLMGLPPGDKTPHGKGVPGEPDTVPEGGLTSPDAEGLNP